MAAWIAITVTGGKGSGSGSGSGSTGSRYEVVAERSIHICRVSRGVEWQTYLYLYDTQTGRLVEYLGTFCPGPGDTVVAAALIPVAAEIFRLVPIPSPKIGLNPEERGLTGLATWGWYEGPKTIAVTVYMRGYRVTAVAHPEGYQWTFGDGSIATTASPGSPSSPAVKHVYQTKGEFSVALSVTWSGTYTFTGHGIAGGGPLGSVSLSGSDPYPVVEVRSVLTG